MHPLVLQLCQDTTHKLQACLCKGDELGNVSNFMEYLLFAASVVDAEDL